MAKTDKQTGQRTQASYCTYVVLLDEEALKHAKLRAANPDRVPGMPCLYVGSTGKSKEQRYADHKRGHKASWWVERYGIMLVPEDLVPTTSWSTRAEALAAEARLARELRRLGRCVWSN